MFDEVTPSPRKGKPLGTPTTFVWSPLGRVHILGERGLCRCLIPAERMTDSSDVFPEQPGLVPCQNCKELAKAYWQNLKPQKPKSLSLKARRKAQQRKGNKALRRRDALPQSAWSRLRYDALKKSDGCCSLCGANKARGAVLHVDHIKPVSRHPELALDPDNLQVLCRDCNMGKSNTDQTDWRG